MLKKILIIASMTICFSSSLWANEDADSLAKKLNLLKTLSGDFKQTLVDAKDETLQETTGQFLLKRPGYFRWETQNPFPQLLVSNLQTIWLFDPDLEQVTIRGYDERIAQTPALLMSGDVEKINLEYDVKKIDNDTYQLTPKHDKQLFTQLNVLFAKDRLVQMQLLDSLGQTTTFAFINAVYNKKINDEQFQFTPPEGVDVIVDTL